MQIFAFAYSSVLIKNKKEKKIRRKNKGVYLYTLPICHLLVIIDYQIGTKSKPRQSTFIQWYEMQII